MTDARPQPQEERVKNRRMPPCASCGHGWPFHVIPGGVENIDIYPTERWCVDADCRCRNYVESKEANGA